MKSVAYLDRLIEAKGFKNDLALAKAMGWPSSRMSQYRTGKRVMENETCVQIALELGMESPLPIIMAADMDRAERAGQRSLWEVFSRRMATPAAPATLAALVAVIASVTNFVTPSTAQAAPALDRDGRTLSVMSNHCENLPCLQTEPFNRTSDTHMPFGGTLARSGRRPRSQTFQCHGIPLIADFDNLHPTPRFSHGVLLLTPKALIKSAGRDVLFKDPQPCTNIPSHAQLSGTCGH